jgi:signal transduction histidine kinase
MRKSRRGGRIPLFIFVGVMLLALAQTLWWTLYQYQQSVELREAELARYEAQIAAVQLELQRIGRPLSLAERQNLHELYPAMALSETDEGQTGLTPVVSTEVLEQVWQDSRSRTRMLAAEGAFFALLLVFGLWLQLLAYRRLADSVRQQSNFISAVTHELKSPLTSISLFAELLDEESVADETRLSAAASILEESARLTALVEQILRVRTLDARDMRLEKQPVDLTSVVSRQIEALARRAEGSGIKLVSQAGNSPMMVRGDAEALCLIVGNLLDNALKYSETGTCITAGLKRHGKLVECWVQDEGAGFHPEEGRRLFDRFYRGGDEMTRRTTGTGLGLYLVREFAEAMDGRVRADSEGPGTGACFTLTLPLLNGKDV